MKSLTTSLRHCNIFILLAVIISAFSFACKARRVPQNYLKTDLESSDKTANKRIVILNGHWKSDYKMEDTYLNIKEQFLLSKYIVIDSQQLSDEKLFSFVKEAVPKNVSTDQYLLYISSHGSIENTREGKMHFLDSSISTKIQVIDPIIAALKSAGVLEKNILIYVDACYSGWLMNDFKNEVGHPTIIPSTRPDAPATGWDENIVGLDEATAIFLKLFSNSEQRKDVDLDNDEIITVDEYEKFINKQGFVTFFSPPKEYNGPILIAKQTIGIIGNGDDIIVFDDHATIESPLDWRKIWRAEDAEEKIIKKGKTFKYLDKPIYPPSANYSSNNSPTNAN